MVSNNFSATEGRSTGARIQMISKAGTNALHGGVSYYFQNNTLASRTVFEPNGVPVFRRNQFGYFLGGPVIKNRTFFSFSYDGWRYSQPGSALSYVPTAAEIAGDFSNTSARFRRQIFNPYSTRQVGTTVVRDAFRCDPAGNPLPVNAQKVQDQSIGSVCNKIPQALIFLPMQQFFKTYSAVPNYFVAGDVTNNFIQVRPTTNDSNSYQVRVDHRFWNADNIFFRYTEHRVTVFNPIGEQGSTSGSSSGRNYGGGWTHPFTPSLILDVRAGYAGRPGVDSGQQNQHEAGLDPLNQAGFRDVDKYGGLLVTLANWTNGGNNNFGVRGPAPRENPNWSVTPNLTWLKGNHNLKTGFWYIEAKRIQENT
ncbi:MAG TPA: hypothetical protein VIJ87_13325, partial [Pyrinomonadaceae bacterium]